MNLQICVVNIGMCVCSCVLSHFSCLTLCNLMDCSPPGSAIPGVFQARILEWVAMPSSRGSSWLRDRTHVSLSPVLADGFFTTRATWEAQIEECFILLCFFFYCFVGIAFFTHWRFVATFHWTIVLVPFFQ